MASGIGRELVPGENDKDLKKYMDKLSSDHVLRPRGERLEVPRWLKESGAIRQCWQNPKAIVAKNPMQGHGKLML